MFCSSPATITVFTCTYNRAHTLRRTYESLCRQTCKNFQWLLIDDGSTDDTKGLVNQWMRAGYICIHYVYKENGGLYTGYNKAIELITTELCMCVDSDDWLPDDAIWNILQEWESRGSDNVAGLIGLDFYPNGNPIGGVFPSNLHKVFISELYKWHKGDVKMVHRTSLLKEVAPMRGFDGEKFANPIYLFLKVDLKYPMLVINTNLCFVEYQADCDSMSKNIFNQYRQSPRSFAQLRILNMSNTRLPYVIRFTNAIHYISSCIMARDRNWLRNSPMKVSTILAIPFGLLLYVYILTKTRNKTYIRKTIYSLL